MPDDPVCADRPVEPALPALDRGIDGLRIAVAGGYFRKGASPEAREAMERVAGRSASAREIEIPEAERARVGGLRHHRDRGRRAASRSAAQRAPGTSIPPCATG